MICNKCGNTLDDNAKFCTKCGNNLSATNVPISDARTEQPPVNMANLVQQPINNISNPTQQIPYNTNMANTIQQKDRTIKIVGGIIIAILIIVIIAKSDENSNLKNDISYYENKVNQYENQINEYENKNAVDKTLDAIDSWLDIF